MAWGSAPARPIGGDRTLLRISSKAVVEPRGEAPVEGEYPAGAGPGAELQVKKGRDPPIVRKFAPLLTP
jgi:hypothetical protein